eukprot:15364502-Ditylum_brightwellii.AAC.2
MDPIKEEKETMIFDVSMGDGKTKMVKGDTFPFLNMSLLWNEDSGLSFGVYRKPKQALKCVDTSSITRPTVYPEHTKALSKAMVPPENSSPFVELQDKEME